MAAVVTGAAGFIGRALVRALLHRGTVVIGVDRQQQASQPGLTALTADLLDGEPRVLAALESADVVYHLAGCSGVRDRRRDIDLRRHRDNPLATSAVLSATPSATPVVVTSSSSVYGGTAGGRACVETDSLRPRGGYAWSKVLVERLCGARLRAGGTVAIARPFTVAGEGQRPDMALARWIADARAGRPLRILGSLSRTRDVTDVNDVVRALIALAEHEVRGPVNIGTGVGHTLRAMVAAVVDALGADVETRVEPASPEEVPATLADTTRLRQTVGFTPVTDLRAIVVRQAAAALTPELSPELTTELITVKG